MRFGKYFIKINLKRLASRSIRVEAIHYLPLPPRMTNNLGPFAFEVVSVTSEHSAHPASELLRRESGNGWQSSPLSDELLQDVVLRLRDGPCSIHTIELLAHEYLIPQKIEIIIASNGAEDDERLRVVSARSFDECTNIQRLGYVAFSQNAESNYSARELKTVSLGGVKADFVKFRLYSPHPNELNIHNQVALVGLELIGCTREDGCDLVEEMSRVSEEFKAGETEEGGDMGEQEEGSVATGGSIRSTTGNGNASTSDTSNGEGISSSTTSERTLSEPALDSNKVTDSNIKVPSTITKMVTSPPSEPRPADDLITASPLPSPSPSPPPSSPLSKPALSVSAKEFTERRKRTNDEVQRRLDRLDQFKLELAAVEDFERAARIKVVVDKTKKSFSKLSNLEEDMRLASEKEDYGEALNLKNQRDTARVEAMHTLDDAESSVAEIIGRKDRLVAAPPETEATGQVASSEVPIAGTTFPPPVGHHTSSASSTDVWQNTDAHEHSTGTGTSNQADAERDLSDEARVCDKPTPPKSSTGTVEIRPHSQYPSTQSDGKRHNQRESTQIHSSTKPGDNSASMSAMQASFAASPDDRQDNDRESDSFSIDSDATTSKLHQRHSNNVPGIEEEYNEDNHPLKGVPDYMALPAPEDINHEGEGIATDTISRIQNLVGSYLTRCFFSRNYSLREAALTKVSLLLPEMGQQQQDEMSPAVRETAHSSSHYLRTVCIMLERAMNDRVIPVFVASLILLDDCISEFEQSGMAPKEVLSHLSVIAPCLVSHLGDNKNKVVEGAETALLSMALSKSIGPAYIAHLLTKRTSEMRAARAIIARMKVAQVGRSSIAT